MSTPALLLRAARWFTSLRIGTRLTLGFVTVLCFTALVGAGATFNLARVNQAAVELAEKWLPAVGLTGDARTAMLEVRELEQKHARAGDDSYRSEYEDKLKEAGALVAAKLTERAALASGDEETKLLKQSQARWAEYLAVNQKVLALGRAGKTDDARDIGDGAAKMAHDDAITALDALTAYSFAAGKSAATTAGAHYRLARHTMLGLMAAALVIGTGLALLIARGLLSQLGGEPTVAAQVARAVAAGDLSTPIVLRPGDRSSLMACLQHMQESLAGVVATVRQGSQRVAGASDEIAQGNSDLSGRTEQQAAALEQTAASMEQLGTTVRQNADHARHADELAQSASAVASRGGEVVTRVVQTMKGINESSRRIGDIIGVIDGIAFQTNILALNAAVEAARAGEQGRGFAVVAAEVRSLARRSADAAREIKGLISASVERVEQGTALVDDAGRTMTEVVDAIGRVTAIMGEISSASREQSAGVAQVGQAVTQMDRATQQNAALVEQSAAAAESLRTQAQALVDVVASFRLAGAAG
jgi:methyl-accepting chemotaxis protein